jgi:hypothetical protein
MLRPAGRPVALNVTVAPSGSIADNCRLTTVPAAVVWLPGELTTGGRLAVE